MDNGVISKEIKDIVVRYVEEVSKYYEIETIILFGSYAKGTYNEDSDIDVAVIITNYKNDIIDEELNLMRLRRKIDTRIEPHIIDLEDYINETTPFVKEIIRTGIKVA